MHRSIWLTLSTWAFGLWVWGTLDYTATVELPAPLNRTVHTGIFFSEGYEHVTCTGTCATACTATQWVAASATVAVAAVVAAELACNGRAVALPMALIATAGTLALEMHLASKVCAPRLPEGAPDTRTTAYRGVYALIVSFFLVGAITDGHILEWWLHRRSEQHRNRNFIELQVMLGK